MTNDPIVRRATDEEQFAAIVTTARRMVRDGATHDCGEWIDRSGRCLLCDAVVECVCRTSECGHRASAHVDGVCEICDRGVCWS